MAYCLARGVNEDFLLYIYRRNYRINRFRKGPIQQAEAAVFTQAKREGEEDNVGEADTRAVSFLLGLFISSEYVRWHFCIVTLPCASEDSKQVDACCRAFHGLHEWFIFDFLETVDLGTTRKRTTKAGCLLDISFRRLLKKKRNRSLRCQRCSTILLNTYTREDYGKSRTAENTVSCYSDGNIVTVRVWTYSVLALAWYSRRLVRRISQAAYPYSGYLEIIKSWNVSSYSLFRRRSYKALVVGALLLLLLVPQELMTDCLCWSRIWSHLPFPHTEQHRSIFVQLACLSATRSLSPKRNGQRKDSGNSEIWLYQLPSWVNGWPVGRSTRTFTSSTTECRSLVYFPPLSWRFPFATNHPESAIDPSHSRLSNLHQKRLLHEYIRNKSLLAHDLYNDSNDRLSARARVSISSLLCILLLFFWS